MKKQILYMIIIALLFSCSIERGIFYTLQTEQPLTSSGMNKYSTIHAMTEDKTNFYVLGNMIMKLEKSKVIDTNNREDWDVIDKFDVENFIPKKKAHLSARDLINYKDIIYASFSNDKENRLFKLIEKDKTYSWENLDITINLDTESGNLSELGFEIIKLYQTANDLYILCNDKTEYLKNETTNIINHPPKYFLFLLDIENLTTTLVKGMIGNQDIAKGFNYLIEKFEKYTDKNSMEKYIFAAENEFYQINNTNVSDSGISAIADLKEIESFAVMPIADSNDIITVTGWFINDTRKRFRTFTIFPEFKDNDEKILSSDFVLSSTTIDPTQLKGTKVFFVNKGPLHNDLILIGTRLGFYDYNPLTLDASRKFIEFSYTAKVEDGVTRFHTKNKPTKTGTDSKDPNTSINYNSVSHISIISQALYNVPIINFYLTELDGSSYLFAMTAGNSLWYSELGPNINTTEFKIWKRI